jgi:riboflavin transporter FmnP
MTGSINAKAEQCTAGRSINRQENQMAKASRSIQMGPSMRDISVKANVMVLVEVSHLKAKFSKVPSLMTKWMAMGTSNGLMVPCSKANGLLAGKMEKESSTGLMGSCMMVNSKTMSVMGTESSITHAAKSLKANGKTGRKMAAACTLGQMVHDTILFTLTAKSRVKVFLRIVRYLWIT